MPSQRIKETKGASHIRPTPFSFPQGLPSVATNGRRIWRPIPEPPQLYLFDRTALPFATSQELSGDRAASLAVGHGPIGSGARQEPSQRVRTVFQLRAVSMRCRIRRRDFERATLTAYFAFRQAGLDAEACPAHENLEAVSCSLSRSKWWHVRGCRLPAPSTKTWCGPCQP